MYQRKLVCLLCATLLVSQPAFAKETAKAKSGKASTETVIESSGLTLDNAITKALQQSPRLQAFRSNISAAKGEQRQAGAWSNPEVGVEAENISGGGNYKGFDSAEVTYGISQEFQIGGKISSRKQIAGRGVEIANLEYQAVALDIIRDVTSIYAEAVASEEKVRLATEQKELAQDVLKSVSIRVDAAAAPLIQKSRAEVELATSTIALDTATRERDIAYKNLATLLGEEQFVSSLNNTAFYNTDSPEAADLEEQLKANPDLIRLNASLEQSKARLDLEKANAVPDPRLNVGMRDFRDSGDQAFVVGVSLPIPVFNANRGNIEKARSEVSKTEQENRNSLLLLGAELTRTKQQMENASVRAGTLKNNVLPSANKAFRLAREGYGQGRFPYLEVLDSQRSLFEVKQQHIEALKEFHIAKAQVERLTAVHLSMIQNQGVKDVK